MTFRYRRQIGKHKWWSLRLRLGKDKDIVRLIVAVVILLLYAFGHLQLPPEFLNLIHWGQSSTQAQENQC